MNRGLRNELTLLAGLASVGCLAARKGSWAAGLGLLAAGLRFLPKPAYVFEGRAVVITGGSRGLGLALAEQFLAEGASVALLARDKAELERAELALQAYSPKQVLAVPCDITEPVELKRAFGQVENLFGRIDVLVNCAGSIAVGPFETMEYEDFQAQFDLQIHAVVNAIRLALPSFRRLGEGRIANISSIGGRLPVPHMTTYCASKFALAGFSEAIAAELAPENIKVTTVFPGLMRTGSPKQAVFKGDHEKEYAWFTTGDVSPGVSVPAEYAARQILEGIRNGDAQVAFPWVTHMGMLAHNLFPETYAFVNAQAARFFPKGQSHERKTGAESRDWLERQAWFKPLKARLDNAESHFNQVDKVNADFNLGVESGN